MRASKLLQAQQLPLFVLRVPKLRPLAQAGGESPGASKAQLVGGASSEPLISFGRRHLSVWAADAKQGKLRLMQAQEQKSAKLSEAIARANCLCRMSPNEFLLGDSSGSLLLLVIICGANQETPATKSATTKRRATGEPLKSTEASNARYSIEAIKLLSGSLGGGGGGGGDEGICCVTRISGSLFMSADAACTIRFWRINRKRQADAKTSANEEIQCELLSSISLPPDLGFICALVLAQYNLRDSIVEFYVISTSNSILFGSVKLRLQTGNRADAGDSSSEQRHQQQADLLLANSSLSVVYEGHETSVSALVADSARQHGPKQSASCLDDRLYFTCSLDCRICKWNGRQLVWKSMLPSACVSLACHPLGCVLAVGSIDGTVYILDKTTGLLISYFPLTPVRINCLAYSSDGSLLAAGCSNGSIFMLPVDEAGLKYKKVSIFQSPNAVVSLQFSRDNRYMLTSTVGPNSGYQELILWDLPNFRYMRDDVKLTADKIHWFDSICSGSEDVRAIWENAHLSNGLTAEGGEPHDAKAGRQTSLVSRRPPQRRATNTRTGKPQTVEQQFVVNLSCHRLIRDQATKESHEGAPAGNFVIASDTRGYLRLFQYPAYDIQQGFYAIRVSSSAVNCCRFLAAAAAAASSSADSPPVDYFVSTSLDGSICLWALE